MTFVATSNGKPIGMNSLRKTDGIQPDLTPWLGSLLVHPAYRRCKIGEALINEIKRQALLLGYKKMYLFAFDTTIPNWYKTLGWGKIGTDQMFNHPVTVMSINL